MINKKKKKNLLNFLKNSGITKEKAIFALVNMDEEKKPSKEYAVIPAYEKR